MGKSLGKEHPYCAENANKLANLYKDLHEYKKAESLYLEAKKIRESIYGKEHIDYYTNCLDLANLYRIIKRPEEAYNLYAEAYISQTTRLKNIFQFTSEAEKQSYLKKNANFTDYFFSFFTSAYTDANQLSYDVSLSNRNLILSSSQQLRAGVYNAIDTSIKNKYNSWIDLREQLAFWYTKPVAERPDYVKDLEEQANTLEKELTRISSAFQKQQAQNDITLANHSAKS